jgi:hypothetical protein
MKKPSICLSSIAAGILLLGVMLALFAPALFEEKIFAPLDITKALLAPWNENAGGEKPHNHNPSDAVTQYLPYRMFAEQSLREDGYVGWNPYEMGGYSLAANTMALPGNWTMQLHRWLSFKDAWNLGVLAEFLIAGFGMLVFLRARGLPWLAVSLGAVAYMLNSQFIIWCYHRWALGSFCWMPWVFWAADGANSDARLSYRRMLVPVFLALALLGGSLQHMAFVVLACGCWLAGGIPDWRSPGKNLRPVLAWGVAIGLALVFSAFSWVPQVQGYLTNNAMGLVRGKLGYPYGFTQPFFNFAAIFAQIWPWLLGDPQSLDGWRLLKSFFLDLAYFGTLPMILAFAGLCNRSMPSRAKWLMVVGLLIPLTPLVGPLYHRVQLLFLLGGAWMAAEMVARFMKHPPVRLAKACAVAVIALGGLLLVGSVLPAKMRGAIEQRVVSQAVSAASDSQFGADTAWIERRAKNWTDRFALHHPKTAWVYGLLVLGTAGLCLTASGKPSRAKWGRVALIGATALELGTFFQGWATFSPPGDLHPEHPAIDRVRELAGVARVTQSPDTLAFANVFATPNLLSSYRIASVDAYESIQYPSTFYLLRNEDPALRFTLAGVGLSVRPVSSAVPGGMETWPVVETVSGYEIRKNLEVPAPVLAGKEPNLPADAVGLLPVLRNGVPIIPQLTTMNRRVFQAPAEARWVRISQNWHPGWHWKFQDESWQTVRKGIDGCIWLDLEPQPAARLIEVRFSPRPCYLGYLSIGGGVIWLLFFLWFKKRGHFCVNSFAGGN